MENYEEYIGQTLNEAVESEIKTKHLGQVRIIRPGYFYDQAYQVSRLNVRVSHTGTILSFSIG